MKYFWTSSGRDLVICFQHGVLTATHVKCALYQLANFTLTLIPQNTLWTIWYWRLNFHVHQSSFFIMFFAFFLFLYLKNLFIQCKLFFLYLYSLQEIIFLFVTLLWMFFVISSYFILFSIPDFLLIKNHKNLTNNNNDQHHY